MYRFAAGTMPSNLMPDGVKNVKKQFSDLDDLKQSGEEKLVEIVTTDA